MSQVNTGQLCEVFRGIAEKRITREAVQQLIQNPRGLTLLQLFTNTLELTIRTRTANKTSNFERQIEILANIACLVDLKSKYFELVERKIDEISDLNNKDRARAIFVEALAKNGFIRKAHWMANYYLSVPEHKEHAACFIVKALVNVGQIGKASRITEHMTIPQYKAIALAAVVYGSTIAGFTEEAEKKANSADNLNVKNRALAAFVEGLAKERETDRAGKVADEIKDYYEKGRAMLTLARTFAEDKDYVLADDIVAKIKDSEWRDKARLAIITEMLSESFFGYDEVLLGRAYRLESKITDSFRKAEAKIAIIEYLARKEFVEEARYTVDEIKDSLLGDYYRAKAMTAIAGITHEPKDFKEALKMIELIEDPYWVPDALITILKTLADAVQTEII